MSTATTELVILLITFFAVFGSIGVLWWALPRSRKDLDHHEAALLALGAAAAHTLVGNRHLPQQGRMLASRRVG